MIWLLACTSSDPEVPPAPPGSVAKHAGLEVWTRSPLDPVEGEVLPYEGYTVRPVSLQVFEGYRVSAALWLPEEVQGGVLMAHGHFGQGKSSGEAQAPAHLYARNGYAVLAVDPPGVEEGDRPDRAIHFEAGATNRALLWAHGTSAMAVQLHGLQAGLDYLEGYTSRLAVAGSSGGAVQALYVLLSDPRPQVAVLASMVPVPREARASGCACDVLPGWEGPDPALLASIDRPVLWMSEVKDTPRPLGLPKESPYQVHPGPHGFEEPMQRASLDFLEKYLGGGSTWYPPINTPESSLASKDVGPAGLVGLVSTFPAREAAPASRKPPMTLDCEGSGPRVLTLSAQEKDLEALKGFEVCAVRLRLDDLGVTESLVRNEVYAGGMAAAVEEAGPGLVYAVGPWAVVAALMERPYVARSVQGVPGPEAPAWTVVPGFDYGFGDALRVGEDPAALVDALLPQQ